MSQQSNQNNKRTFNSTIIWSAFTRALRHSERKLSGGSREREVSGLAGKPAATSMTAYNCKKRAAQALKTSGSAHKSHRLQKRWHAHGAIVKRGCFRQVGRAHVQENHRKIRNVHLWLWCCCCGLLVHNSGIALYVYNCSSARAAAQAWIPRL